MPSAGFISLKTSGILDPPDHLFVDHINHNGLDNRKANLRTATRRQNSYNRIHFRKNPYSKYKGVSFKKRTKKWNVQIRYDGQSRFIGSFDSEIEAAKAYDKDAKKHHGEFAVLNFPDSPKIKALLRTQVSLIIAECRRRF
jgi:hypothetical protein